jgi:hypothetical protein
VNLLKRRGAAAATLLTAVLSSPNLFAGAAIEVPVQITPAVAGTQFTRAVGNMFDARASANTIEFIGCELVVENAALTALRTGNSEAEQVFYGRCQASDAEGTTADCETSDPQMIEAISSISSYSYISFFFDPTITTGQSDLPECAQIRASNRSFYLPLTAEDKDKANK